MQGVFSTRMGGDGHIVVEFGDGRFGARLPAGQGNVTATYRVGIGLAGQVRAGQLALAMAQPLGFESVINPLPATGAQDPEPADQARTNAPLTVLTLDRIVSLRDFEDYARAFSGVGKAQATDIWSGERQIVHITATASDGSIFSDSSDTLKNLRSSIDGARHSQRPVVVSGHVERQFSLTMRVKVGADLASDPVLDAVRDHLLQHYGRDARALGQGVEAADVIAEAQSVQGVAAVVLSDLDGVAPSAQPRLPARRAHWDAVASKFLPAELLLIDPNALMIEEIL